jgi:hypothetical protein
MLPSVFHIYKMAAPAAMILVGNEGNYYPTNPPLVHNTAMNNFAALVPCTAEKPTPFLEMRVYVNWFNHCHFTHIYQWEVSQKKYKHFVHISQTSPY